MIGGGGVLALLLVYGIVHFRDAVLAAPAVTVGGLAVFGLLAVATLLFPVLRWLNPRKAMQGYLGKLAVAIVGWVLTNLHLRLFDPLFLRRGRVERLLKLK